MLQTSAMNESFERQTPAGQLLVTFERLSKLEHPLRLSYSRQSSLAQLIGRGVTCADVELVYRFTAAMMSRGKCGFNELSLTFSAMLADPDRFEDRLAAARAWKRPSATPAPLRVVPDPQPAPVWDQAAWAAGAQERAEQRQALLRKGAG